MSKRQFDHIENKIREAAENSEPAFEEQAWYKMEAKLNAEKERKWSPFLWISLALLSLGLLGRIVAYYNQSSKKIGVTQDITAVINSDRNTRQPSFTVNTDDNTITIDSKNSSHQKNQMVDQKNNNNFSERFSSDIDSETKEPAKKHSNSIEQNKMNIVNYNNSVVSKSDRIDKKNNSIEANISGKSSARKNNRKTNVIFVESDNQIAYSSLQKNERKTYSKTSTKIKAAAQVDNIAEDAVAIDNNEILSSRINKDKLISSIGKDKKKDSVQKIVPIDTIAIVPSKKEIKKENTLPKKKSWYLLASVGPDASNVKLLSFKNSIVTPRYGVGIGCQVNKRFSLQTGFYAGRKKYVAGAGDYNDAKDPYLSTININKVEANCLIFDIPVTVRYNFILRPKTTFFATAGISSFIMKKEDYDYYYTVYNNNYKASHSYTGNKNLFSIAAISIGVERKISKSFSIQAEPSVNIPIAAGVGEGTVKLFSTDIQLGVKYNFRW